VVVVTIKLGFQNIKPKSREMLQMALRFDCKS
jgi:hypothetical protein